MANQGTVGPPPGAAASALFAPGPGASSISPEEMQAQVDRAANLNIFSIPHGSAAQPAIYGGSYNAPVGMRIHENLHRFVIRTQPPGARSPITAEDIVGESVGTFTHRWMLAPDDFSGAPGKQPPPTPLDLSRSQRFVMLDSVCAFGNGENGFRGFGTGRTFPMNAGRQGQLHVTAIGTIVEGFGQFQGHEEAIYLYCGTLDLNRGFTGNIILRVMDRQDTFSTDSILPDPEELANPEPDITYVLLRGEAVPSDKVTPRIGPGGQPMGLTVEQGLRLFDIDFKVRGESGIRSTAEPGPRIGKITATINFNPGWPGGTALNPIPFTNFDEFVFTDHQGRRIGGFTGNSSEGRVFLTQISGQPAIRFGGTGQILNGDGPFQGISGLLTDNSVVVFAPHVSASIYVLRIPDPHGRFRGAFHKNPF
ncbi:MAG: hypothetical protein DMG65_11705 [Candidatus Angelobacter sp. Gp1-AA117]|nr:MAG: hypothetical protein DMG65_11705 [Candidatus Angelobacter sp. Gp1-AA117]